MIKQKSILWVEDEQSLIDVYTDALKITDNFNVEFMKLGQSVLDRIKEIEQGKAEKPDLILIDLLLPDVNGETVLEQLKKTPATKDVPVFVLTNYTKEESQRRIIDELKGEKFLIKTEWEPSKIISLIQEALGQ